VNASDISPCPFTQRAPTEEAVSDCMETGRGEADGGRRRHDQAQGVHLGRFAELFTRSGLTCRVRLFPAISLRQPAAIGADLRRRKCPPLSGANPWIRRHIVIRYFAKCEPPAVRGFTGRISRMPVKR
jgi:hypothetical protein